MVDPSQMTYVYYLKEVNIICPHTHATNCSRLLSNQVELGEKSLIRLLIFDGTRDANTTRGASFLSTMWQFFLFQIKISGGYFVQWLPIKIPQNPSTLNLMETLDLFLQVL